MRGTPCRIATVAARRHPSWAGTESNTYASNDGNFWGWGGAGRNWECGGGGKLRTASVNGAAGDDADDEKPEDAHGGHPIASAGQSLDLRCEAIPSMLVAPPPSRPPAPPL